MFGTSWAQFLLRTQISSLYHSCVIIKLIHILLPKLKIYFLFIYHHSQCLTVEEKIVVVCAQGFDSCHAF